MTLEFIAKGLILGMSTVTGGAMLATVEAVTTPTGIEGHLTLATGAVVCVMVLWGAAVWTIKALLKAKDDQIAALRQREANERERADEERKRADDAAAAHRAELADRAKRAESEILHGPPPPPPRQSRRHAHES